MSGGWRLVPEEPTDAMLHAAARALDIWRETVPGNPQRKAAPDEKHAIRYRAMLGAAPAPAPRTPDAGHEDIEEALRFHGMAKAANALADMRRQRDEVRCPIGLDNNPELCSAGCCFVCVQDRLADLRKQATQDALALREAVRQVERLTLERDRYKALAEGASGDRP
jgi:hypothetical protein